MNSPFANIYKSLITRIKEQIPTIATLDMDYGQLEHADRPRVAFPAVLIDFGNWNFTDILDLVQMAEGVIHIKVATNPYSSTEANTPTTYLDDALAILDIEYALYQALGGWQADIDTDGTKTSPLARVNYHPDNRRPGLKVRQLTFETSFQDYSAERSTTLIPNPGPTVTDEIYIPT